MDPVAPASAFPGAGSPGGSRNRWREELHLQEFCQFQFFRQWQALREYAGSRGILLIGDMPIYAALDSADVWANPACFQLDEERRPRAVAGVPPDAFTELGQLWGNPLYDWDYMEGNGFAWWRRRMGLAARLFDVVRIDHFIGLVRYYSVPAEAEDARGGTYFPGPGRRLTEALEEAAGRTAIVAEDLGVFLPEVQELLEETGYPNMKVLEFAFDSGPDNGICPTTTGPTAWSTAAPMTMRPWPVSWTASRMRRWPTCGRTWGPRTGRSCRRRCCGPPMPAWRMWPSSRPRTCWAWVRRPA